MKTLPLFEIKMELSAIVDQVVATDEEVIITKNGQPAAMLISPDEYESRKEIVAVKSQQGLVDEVKDGLQKIRTRNSRLYTLEDLFGDK